MLTTRGTGVLGAAAGMWIAARSFGVPELQMGAVAAVVALVVAVLFTTVASSRLQVDRVVRPARLFHDASATVVLTVANTGRLPTATVTLRDGVPPALGERTPLSIPPVRPGGRLTVTYHLRGRQRGRFRIGPLELVLRDPFGLAARRRTLPGDAEVTVYPPIWQLAAGLPLGGATSTGTGRGRRRAEPDGEDLANVREYVQGDDLRTVHWPSTAHRGKLIVRQAESRREPRAVVVLDVRADRHRGRGPGASLETAVAAAASAGYHLASRGRSVALLDRPFVGTPVAAGWEQVLERLADVTPTTVDLPGLLHQVGRGRAGDGTLLAVLTVPDGVELRALVRAGRGFSTRAALLVDADSHEPGGRVRSAADPGATAAALRAAGWRVTVLRAGDRIDSGWRELLRRQRPGVPA